MSAAWCSFAKAETYSAYFSKAANAEARRLYLAASKADGGFSRPCAELAYAVLQAYLYNWYEGDPEHAIEEMNRWADEALIRDPNDPNNTWVMANVRLYSGDFSGAAGGYQALGGASLNAPPLIDDQWAYQVDYADMKLLTGEAKEAIAIVTEVLKKCPVPEKWFYWVLAWAYYVDGQFEASLEALSQLSNPRNAIRKNVIANLVALGRLGQAQIQAATFLVEEKSQGIVYADSQGYPVLPRLKAVEDRVPFKDPAMRDRWKNDLEPAFGGLVQP
jgi:tetratricopeptide (TPR) repeat protein